MTTIESTDAVTVISADQKTLRLPDLLRANCAHSATNEMHDLMCRARSPRALQSALIGDARDAALMLTLCQPTEESA